MTNNINNDDTLLEDSVAFDETPYIKEGKVTPIHMLSFAKRILLGLGIIFICASATELFIQGNAIFETCKVTIPSLATLVIGYYFGKSSN